MKIEFGTRRKPQKTIRYADQEPEIIRYNDYDVVSEETPVQDVKVSGVPVKAKAKLFDAIVAKVAPERQSRPLYRTPSNSAVDRLRYRSTSSHRSPSSSRSRDPSRTRQEFFRFRDSGHGKPLPGMNQFIGTSWPYGLDQIHKQYEVKNRDNENGIPYNRYPGEWTDDFTPSPSPDITRRFRSVSPPINEESIQKRIASRQHISAPSSPVPEYLKNLKQMELYDPPYVSEIPPKFGTILIGGRWADVAEGPHIDGPPCQLCHDSITENRCFVVDNSKYHCWHYVCTFCCVTLKAETFRVAKDNLPYCPNCYMRMFCCP